MQDFYSYFSKLYGKPCVRYFFQLACFTAIAMCAVLSSACADEVLPDFYKDPGLYPNRDYVNQHTSEHIDPFTGALQIQATDIHLPGNGGFDLDVIRSYNSSLIDPLNPGRYTSLSGAGWTIHFGKVMMGGSAPNPCLNQKGITAPENPVIELPDGSRQLLFFTDSGSPLMLTTQRWKAQCIGSGAGLAVYAPDGIRYDMTHQVIDSGGPFPITAWYTTKITDRNNNYATISYGAPSEISSITTSDDRSISFDYADSGTLSRRITKITAPGQTWTYGYTAIPNVPGRYFLTKVTRPDGTAWGYEYNGNLDTQAGGYLMKKMIYPQGGSISYGYGYVYFDSQANPYSRSDVVVSKSTSDGGDWTFAYTPGGPSQYDVTTVSSPNGTITYKHVGPNYSSSGTVWMVGLLIEKKTSGLKTETYTWSKQLISSENNFRPGNHVTKIDTESYAPIQTKRTIVQDGVTYTTTYSNFDSYGNPQTVTEAGQNGGSRTTTKTYYINTSKWIVKQVDDETVAGGSAITRGWNSNGSLISQSVGGVTTTYGRDSQGNISTITNPRAFVTTYSNYKRGIPQSESHPGGISITRVVSDAGNVTSETNGEGKTFGYSYDGLNRLKGVNYPVGNDLTITYTTTTKTATRGNLVQKVTYDAFGREASKALGGITTTYRHDTLGRKVFASHPNSTAGTTFTYDILNRPKEVKNTVDSTTQVFTYSGATTSVKNERLYTTSYVHRIYGDPAKQFLMQINSPETGTSITIGRNGRDQITSVAQAGLTRTYGYDSRYYLTSVTNPETGTTTYGRDNAGNMTSKKVGTSGTTTFSYDGLNRLETITYPAASIATPNVTKTYYKTGKLKTLNSSMANRSYTYDNNGNLETESMVVDGLTYTTTYSHNGNDQLSSVTYPQSNRVVNYTPDALGRPTTALPYVTDIDYWPSGQISQITYANGTITKYGQNSRLWPSSFSTLKGTTAYMNSTYTYDGVGNLKTTTDAVEGSRYNRTLGYDAIDRLVTANGPWGAGTITYSGGGNITNQTLGSSSLTYTYNTTNNRLTSVSGMRSTSFDYDVYGNINGADGNSFAYDEAPNLRCFNCSSTDNKIEYGYDGANLRVKINKGGVITYEFHNLNGKLLQEATPTRGNQLIHYIYVGDKRVAQHLIDDIVVTTTTLTTPGVQPTVGVPITLTAIVTGEGVTGNVEFYNGSVVLGTVPAVNGQAALTTTFHAPGTYQLSAKYLGTALSHPSTSPTVALQVKYATVTTVSTSPNPSIINHQLSISARVTGSDAPTGTITFKDGVRTLGTAMLSAGTATISASDLTIGYHNLTAEYSGDTDHYGSASVIYKHIVNDKTVPVLRFGGLPAVVQVDKPVSAITVEVEGDIPSGEVMLKDGDTLLGTVNVIKTGERYLASFPNIIFTTEGSHVLTAIYGGDTRNRAAFAAYTVNVRTYAVNDVLIPIRSLLQK